MQKSNSENQKSAFWKDKGTLMDLTSVAFGLILAILTAVGLAQLN